MRVLATTRRYRVTVLTSLPLGSACAGLRPDATAVLPKAVQGDPAMLASADVTRHFVSGDADWPADIIVIVCSVQVPLDPLAQIAGASRAVVRLKLQEEADGS